MSSTSGLGGAGDLTPRQRFVNLVPALMLIVIPGALVLSGAPQSAPSFDLLVDNAREYGWAGAAAVTAAALVATLLLEPLELMTIRVLEGYWSARGALAGVARFGQWVQERRRARLRWIDDHLPEHHPLAEEARRRLPLLPDGDNLLPTTLGNRLRALEERAGVPYDLDAITAWPRLYYVLPKDALDVLSDSRNQLDTAARLSISFGLAGVISTGLLAQHGWWLLVPAVLLLLAWASYRAAVEAAATYTATVFAAFDVYRLKLLQTMRVEMPPNSTAERAINDRLTRTWQRSGGIPPEVNYSPTDTDVGVRHTWPHDETATP